MPWPFRPSHPEPDQGPAPIDASAIVRRVRRLRFRARPANDLAGAYLGARPGTGLAFRELRPYEPGDDVRHLDWNATARQGRPYVRHFAEERAQVVRLIVDVSASLRFGPEGRSKADLAAQAAALLAAAALHGGDRVGLLLVSDRIEAEIPPAGTPRHLATLLRALVATPIASPATDLAAAMPHLGRTARRSLIVVLSDFLTPLPEIPWSRVARRHQVFALRLVDPREETLPAAGLLTLEDAETGAKRLVDSDSRHVRTAHAEAAEARRTAFRSWCAATGIAGCDLSTEDDPLTPLIRFFRNRPRSRTAR